MPKNIIDILKHVGAIMSQGHFVGTSGRHMSSYINKDGLTVYTQYTSKVGKLFAEKFKNRRVDIVAAPAVGGVILSQWTAHHLSKLKKKPILSVYTVKNPENDQVFKRGYDEIVKGKHVLIIEDATTTGGSVKKVIKSVRKAGGKITAVCVMINRDPKRVTSRSIGAPFSALGVFDVPSYDEHACPLCKQGVPINSTLGHGKEYLAKTGRLH